MLHIVLGSSDRYLIKHEITPCYNSNPEWFDLPLKIPNGDV